MNLQAGPAERQEMEFLHELGERIASADPLDKVLGRILEFIFSPLVEIAGGSMRER